MRHRIACGTLSLVALTVSTAHALPASRLAYAQACEAEMGRTPGFNCMNGAVIPITKNGVAVTSRTNGDDCDNPVQLGLANDNQCVPFSRFLRLDTGNPNVETAVICRKYDEDDNGAADTHFTDIAVVQHNKVTGNTCFYQSRIGAHLDGTSAPSPQENSTNASNFWLEPAISQRTGRMGPGTVQCTMCHDADPFIWSKYIIQVANTGNWNALGSWNSNFQDMFGLTVKTFRPSNNTCVTCHRIGSETSNSNDGGGGHVSVREVSDKHWMPPGFAGSDSDWLQLSGTAVQELYKCFDDPAQANCRTIDQDGTDRARFVSQTQPALPVQPGQAFDISATFKNTGSVSWDGPRFMAPVQSGPGWGPTQKPLGSAAAPVRPLDDVTETFTLNAPATPGTYTLSMGVFAPSVYGPQRIAIGLPSTVVVSGPTGQFESASITIVTFPSPLAAGATGTVSVSVSNNGNTPWSPGAYVLRLSRLNRVSLPTTQVALPAAVPPGGSVNLSFSVICASPGTGGFGAQMAGPSGAFGQSVGRTIVCQ